MTKGSRVSMSVKRMVKDMEKGLITFDNIVQRGLVWDKDQKSMLIDTILQGYPIPAMYANKTKDENKTYYDMLDGKQRCNTLREYVSGEFALTEIVNDIYNEDENEEVVISGCKFEELPESFRDEILSQTIDIFAFDDLSDDEIAEIFKRLNNGKPLSAIELTKVNAKSLKTLVEMSKHEIFTSALTKKALASCKDLDIIVKSYATLYMENPSFETKDIRPLTREVEITDEIKNRINSALDMIYDAYKILKSRELEEKDEIKKRDKVCSRMMKATHMLSLVHLTTDERVNAETMADFCMTFFDAGKRTTPSNIYNDNARSRTGKTSAVKARFTEIDKYFDEFAKRQEMKVETKVEEETKEEVETVVVEVENIA